MVTITELLTEVFNRVKIEHGVVLSRVDFAPASGAVGVAFRGVGCSKPVASYRVVLQPSPYMGDDLRPPPPEATHYGSIGGSTPRYYRFTALGLFGWSVAHGWCPYVSLSDTTDAELVRQLTPLNPSSQSVTDSGS